MVGDAVNTGKTAAEENTAFGVLEMDIPYPAIGYVAHGNAVVSQFCKMTFVWRVRKFEGEVLDSHLGNGWLVLAEYGFPFRTNVGAKRAACACIRSANTLIL